MLITFLLIIISINAQNIKTSVKTKESYFVKYPERVLGYEFLEYKSEIIPDNTVISFLSDGKPFSEYSINNSNCSLIRTKAKENRLPLGNLLETNKTGSGTLHVIVDFQPMKLYSRQDNVGKPWEQKYRNSFVLDVPLKVTMKNSYNGAIIKEEIITAKYDNVNLAALISEKDEMIGIINSDFANPIAAKQKSFSFLQNNYESIALSVFDNLISNNQIASYWKIYSNRYKLYLERTGTLFFEFFKDEKNTKLAEYNQKISRLTELSDKIGESSFKQNVIAKVMLTEISQISEYLENELKMTENEDIKSALQTNLINTYLITSNFEKAIPVVNNLIAKRKINLRINSRWEALKEFADAKSYFENNKSSLSFTYSETLSKILK